METDIKNEDFIYSLRYAIEPGFRENDSLDRLLAFCKKAKIDDVMFFINCEELNRGHLTPEETKPWMDLIARCKPELASIGVKTSINPWITMLHTDRSRILKEGQDFDLMTDPYGNKATAVVCPLCQSWQEYLKKMYMYYAEPRPWILWVEDDFRFHNHTPLVWGGCFCDRHMEMFSEKAGKKITRDEFVSGMLRQGEPHPYRKIWLDSARDTLVSIAEMIGEAVHGISPETRVGLMSSAPSVHCAEGRDWEGILSGLAQETPMVNRPTLCAYEEITGKEYLWHFSTVTRMTQAMIPGSAEIYPELENVPYTRYSKSIAFTRFQIETSSAVHSSGITMNLFDMAGNGIRMDEGYQDMLSEEKGFLSCIKKLDLGIGRQTGIKILTDPRSSYTLKTRNGVSMDELYTNEAYWAGLFSSFGISNVYGIGCRHKGSFIAVSGQYFRNLSSSEIDDLFRDNFVFLEGEAAYTLWDMGKGHLAGIGSARWHAVEEFRTSYEKITDGKRYGGLLEARIGTQYYAGDYLEIGYTGNYRNIGSMADYNGEDAGAGMTVYDNKVFILPYGCYDRRNLSHINPIVKDVMLAVLKNAGPISCPVYIENAPYVSVLSYDLGDRTALVVFNAGGDVCRRPSIYTGSLEYGKVTEINRERACVTDCDCSVQGEYLHVNSSIDAMELKVILLERGEQ
jgi:hypothetical protein